MRSNHRQAGDPVSASIDYGFKHATDLRRDGQLESVVVEWNKAFGGTPYESWSWFEPVAFGAGFEYHGAIKLPDSAEQAWGAIQIAADLLSRLRNAVGGTDWRVAIDTHELPWDAQAMEFDAS
jgi:hypothetical protein